MRIAWPDFALLDEAGFGLYEKRALVTLAMHGLADAATLCREGDIPTSKIYAAMEKLADLGLVEVQRSRPKLYASLPVEPMVERLVALARQRAEDFARQAEALRAAFAGLPQKLSGGAAQVDLALGMESHVKRHLSRLVGARERVLSYMEVGDIEAIERVEADGFRVLPGIARAHAKAGVKHRAVFGLTQRSAPRLLAFLRTHAAPLQALSAVRYSGEIGHPFHIVDDELVILSLDHPFVPDGRYASLLVRDRELAQRLAAGFESLWRKGLKDLREIRAWPSALA